eukprot:TRINITY_DN43364_c0_g1_i1.p2 TRINITY_DN43364_c0_g1~~TRINITY_DN43364_c0_g1_i1.p2  ORF type:complete len:319 (+),score=11.03 TRINITY_DN43364_c0_g1_i1:1403-2359(+)
MKPEQYQKELINMFAHSENAIIERVCNYVSTDLAILRNETGAELLSIILDIHTTNFPCSVCEYSLVGFMNDPIFSKALHTKLAEFCICANSKLQYVTRLSYTSNSNERASELITKDKHRTLKPADLSKWENTSTVIFSHSLPLFTTKALSRVTTITTPLVMFTNRSRADIEALIPNIYVPGVRESEESKAGLPIGHYKSERAGETLNHPLLDLFNDESVVALIEDIHELPGEGPSPACELVQGKEWDLSNVKEMVWVGVANLLAVASAVGYRIMLRGRVGNQPQSDMEGWKEIGVIVIICQVIAQLMCYYLEFSEKSL